MSQAQWTAVDNYFTDLLVPADRALDEALRASEAAGLPSIHVAANQGKFLHLLAKIQGATRILEIGTLGGYSTIWLARALPAAGRLISLEFMPHHAEVAQSNIKNAGLQNVVEIRVGKALDLLPEIAREKLPPFDLVFIDADKVNTAEYFQWALKLSRVGSVIIADNVVREGAIIDADSTDASVPGVRRFNEMLAAERRVTATAIQTVGSKGHDGFAMAVVIAES
jgi:predicted O-methyltransferase YrrM